MKNILFFVVPIWVLMLLSSCTLSIIKGSGVFVDEERTPSAAFTEIHNAGDFKVIVMKDPVAHFTIHGEDNIVPEVTTEVNNGQLTIRYKKQHLNLRHKGVTVYVYTPALSAMVVSGSGDFECMDDFTADAVKLTISGSGNIVHTGTFTTGSLIAQVSGSGDITAKAQCASVEASVSGSGDITLSGTTQSQEVDITGSGEIQLLSMPTQNSNIDITGSGDCRVDVSTKLDVRISGSGNVFYNGTPIVTLNVTGSGKVQHL